MTKHERIILKYSRRLGADNMLNTEKLIGAGIPLSAREIFLCCEYMKTKDCFDVYSAALDETVVFHLSYTGQHPYEFSWISFRNFVIRSVFVPIVVSAATTWLLSVIGGM